jgi:hypothetical protein
MIKSFGSLFADHIDLEQKGLDGTSVNERWLSDESWPRSSPRPRPSRR